MEIVSNLINFIIHIDTHLGNLVTNYGVWVYGILFLIIFAETGFVLTPFLPGDSLLFAAGALAALGHFNIVILIFLLCISAIAGDTANYWIGKFFGQTIVNNPKIPINQEHIDKTNKFYEKHGGKTIILARFIPIIRTFAPFVAGVGHMSYPKFVSFNVIGGIVWVLLFTSAGYLFGNIKAVKDNFSLVILAIIVLSLLPMLVEFVKSKLKKH
jgi:membrane-associated protein